jgi:hypothetical protein
LVTGFEDPERRNEEHHKRDRAVEEPALEKPAKGQVQDEAQPDRALAARREQRPAKREHGEERDER